ncbi:MAG: hypothetical protein ACON47_08710 [Flavobacteriaceae bacterium]
MRKTSCVIALFGLIFLNQCASAKNQFEKGNYQKAVNIAIKKLQSNPKNKKNRSILKTAYDYALNIGDQKIQRYENETSLQKYDKIVSHYRGLQNIYYNLLSCPGCLTVVSPVTYQDNLNRALNDAAKAYATEGKLLLERNIKGEARSAFHLFQKANNYIRNSVNQNLLNKALVNGMERIAISTIPVASKGLEISSVFFQQQLIQRLRSLNYLFADFQPLQSFQRKNSTPDWLVELSFDDYAIGQVYLKETRESVVKDSVPIKSIRDSLGIRKTIYGSVKADVIRYEKTIESGGLLNIIVRSVNDNSIRMQSKLPSTFVWINDWVTYQGDQRALSNEELELAKEKEEIPPSPQALFQAFTQPLFQQTARQLQGEFFYLKE